MSKTKKLLGSFQELGEYYKKQNEERLKKQETLTSHGIDIPLDEIDHITIINSNKRIVTYIDERTGETITSDLASGIHDRWGKRYSIGIKRQSLDKPLFVEEFYEINPVHTYTKAGKEALNSLKNPEMRLLSRTYVDVSTKYGDFCLEIEDSSEKCKWGVQKQVSLYYGTHEQAMTDWSNRFEFNDLCLFRWKNKGQYAFDQWMIGFTRKIDDGPRRNIWNYGDAILNGKKVATPVYSCHNRLRNDGAVIFLDGRLKLADNSEHGVDELFEYLKMEEYEDKDYTSKAYFANYRERVAILKTGNTITIEYKIKKRRTGEWMTAYSIDLASSQTGEFSHDDFIKLLSLLDALPFRNRMKEFLASELTAYLNVHCEATKGIKKEFSLKDMRFEDAVETLKSQDATALVEGLIDYLCETFHMSLEDFFGENPFEQGKDEEVGKQIKFKQKDK